MIDTLLSQNFDVKIYVLFPQLFCDRTADFTNFFAFRMYDKDMGRRGWFHLVITCNDKEGSLFWSLFVSIDIYV